MKLINTLLLTTILFSLVFGQLLRFHFISFLPSFYLHDLLLGIFLTFNFKTILSLPKNKLTFSFVLFLFSLFIFNPNYLLTLRLAVYFLFFLSLSNLKFYHSFINQTIYLAIFLTLILGLVQFLFLPDLRFLANLGWDDHLNRLTFPYFDPNFTGFIFTLFFFYLYPRRSAWLFFPPLGLTYSRSALLTWLVGFLIYSRRRLTNLLSAGILLLLLITLLPHRFGEGNNLLRAYSIKARFNYDSQVLTQLFHHPLRGKVVGHYQTPFSFNRSGTANNSFLYLWQVGGIFSLLTFLYFLKHLLPSLHQPKLWTLTIFASFFNNILFYPFVLLWLFFLEITDAKPTSESF